MKASQLVVTLLIGLLSLIPSESVGCSWVTVVVESDRRVLVIGTVAGHLAETVEGRSAFGVVVEPIFEFRSDSSGEEEQYEVFPHGVGADCSAQYYQKNPTLEKHFSLGRLVTLIGFTANDEAVGNLALSWGSGLDVVPIECEADEIAKAKPTYPIQERLCGTEEFHIYKDLAVLREGSEGEVVEILTRISQVTLHTKFEELVNKFVTSKEKRQELLKLRYADVIEAGCGVEPGYDYDYDDNWRERRLHRARWFEYCTQARRDSEDSGT